MNLHDLSRTPEITRICTVLNLMMGRDYMYRINNNQIEATNRPIALNDNFHWRPLMLGDERYRYWLGQADINGIR